MHQQEGMGDVMVDSVLEELAVDQLGSVIPHAGSLVTIWLITGREVVVDSSGGVIVHRPCGILCQIQLSKGSLAGGKTLLG